MTSIRANGSTTGADILIKKRDENGFLVDQILPGEDQQRKLRLQKKEEQDQEQQQQQQNQKPVIDAGLKSLDHYKHALPKWRYELRQRALPLIRWETPYLAWMQAKLRTPALDRYFAITANLGTHTFFMIFLPIMFWCGFASFGKGIVHILASGVFWSGFIKDFFSLPRPLSPPLHRITMSGSVALEYGFPSTHSANAVSVAVYCILSLRAPEAADMFAPSTRIALEALSYFYAVSIIFGRLYCGMHGFIDVIFGSVLGAIITLIEWYGAPAMESHLYNGGWEAILFALLIIIVLIRIHPEPADDCPCFDDSVCFAGVLMGLEGATWHLERASFGPILHPFDMAGLGWVRATTRILAGILAILVWKEAAKPVMLRSLPHLFRLIETYGLDLPRRFFVPASEYSVIPPRLRVDNVMPSVSDIPQLITSMRHPGRGRSVSVGPQSAADAYETLAYRERRRRESIEDINNNAVGLRSKDSVQDLGSGGGTTLGDKGRTPSQNRNGGATGGSLHQHQHIGWDDKVREFERQMGEGTVLVGSPVASVENSNGNGNARPGGAEEPDLYVSQQNEDDLGEREVFSKLVKPRVRYDVEVITKLVVYAGIGWIAVEGVPVLFEMIPGLGVGHLR